MNPRFPKTSSVSGQTPTLDLVAPDVPRLSSTLFNVKRTLRVLVRDGRGSRDVTPRENGQSRSVHVSLDPTRLPDTSMTFVVNSPPGYKTDRLDRDPVPKTSTSARRTGPSTEVVANRCRVCSTHSTPYYVCVTSDRVRVRYGTTDPPGFPRGTLCGFHTVSEDGHWSRKTVSGEDSERNGDGTWECFLIH